MDDFSLFPFRLRKLFIVKTSFSFQAPSISSRVTPTGSSHFQAPRYKMDTHDPLLQTFWTALTSPRPQTTSPCLCLRPQADRRSGSNGGRRKRRKQQEGGTTGGVNIGINIRRRRTQVHTFGQDAPVKMELLFAGQKLWWLSCC